LQCLLLSILFCLDYRSTYRVIDFSLGREGACGFERAVLLSGRSRRVRSAQRLCDIQLRRGLSALAARLVLSLPRWREGALLEDQD
jgi:hypothetical protein